MVAWHTGPSGAAARSPQGLGHPGLVAADPDEDDGEEASVGTGCLPTGAVGSGQGAVLDPHVASPQAVLPGA